MRHVTHIIFFGFLVGFLVGCRANLDTSRQESRRQTDVIGVELRRVDSLWSSIAERLNFKIEFYPSGYPEYTYQPCEETSEHSTGSPLPTDPATASHLLNPQGGGVGSVKSLEFSVERDATTNQASRVDSTYNEQADNEETLQKETETETRHDNGTVLIVAIVAGLVVFALAWLLLKTFLKR